MEKNGLMRTLKFGSVYAEKMFAMAVFMGIVYNIFFYLEASDRNHFMVPSYFASISAIMLFIIQILNNARYVPISISFGSSRKNTIIGIQWMNFMLIVQSVVLFGIILLIFPGELEGAIVEAIVIYLIVLLVFGGIGQLLSAASLKFGNVVGVLIGAGLFISIISGIVAVVVISATNGADNKSPETIIAEVAFIRKLLVSVFAVLIYVIGTYFNSRMLKKYEVRV